MNKLERLDMIYQCRLCDKKYRIGLYVDNNRLDGLTIDAQRPMILIHTCDDSNGKVVVSELVGAISLTHDEHDIFTSV